ncbi:hypothetical protein DYI37_10020 [Fulvimarina endophytica]|uniref:Uncharacterized protein n=1 Tax=Fulvimarina endophytica TaxID=2293836 RepID=A0A371X2C2_9HYPH|nr:hypothetical protein DYI37_10020 [Fulvimarina endophytica]
MWFNHKTVIFGGLKASSKKAGAASRKTRTMIRLGHALQGDSATEPALSVARASALAAAVMYESRFTGYRGEVPA